LQIPMLIVPVKNNNLGALAAMISKVDH
jgi:hypothetical protein